MYRELFPDVSLEIMSFEEAELTKVAYNTFISMKIVFANTLMEICDRLNANVDNITEVLVQANRRIISPAYLSGGMGDGGACHPRDNIAMSWLAGHLDLSCDPFEFVTRARELQSQYLANEVTRIAIDHGLPVVILGKAYKPESDLTYGSPALLLEYQLEQKDHYFNTEIWDPFVDCLDDAPDHRAVYVIATRHKMFQFYKFPKGSVVIDPHRYIKNSDVEVIPIGARSLSNHSNHSAST